MCPLEKEVSRKTNPNLITNPLSMSLLNWKNYNYLLGILLRHSSIRYLAFKAIFQHIFPPPERPASSQLTSTFQSTQISATKISECRVIKSEFTQIPSIRTSISRLIIFLKKRPKHNFISSNYFEMILVRVSNPNSEYE